MRGPWTLRWPPSFCIFMVASASQCQPVPGKQRFPYQAKPRFRSAWHLSQVPRFQNSGWGESANSVANSQQLITTIMHHLPGAIPHLFDLPASLLEAVRLPMVAYQVPYGYSNEYVVALCSSLSDSNCLPGSLGKSKCIQVIWRGIFPKLSWPECSSVTFHYEKLDESIGCWAELDRYVTIGSVVRNDVMEAADGGVVPPLFCGIGVMGAMMTCCSLQRRYLIGQEGPYLYAKSAEPLIVPNSWTPGTRSSGDRFECATFIQNFSNISPFQYVYKPLKI